MRVAQVTPLWESVPPKRYGGVERIVSYLTDELVRLGHEVTLFASGDSVTPAHLEAICPHALRYTEGLSNQYAFPTLLLERAFGSKRPFEIIHSHLDCVALPLARRSKVPVLHTIHGRLDLPELQAVFSNFPEARLVSISNAQRCPLPASNWMTTIYHGLPRNLYPAHLGEGRYLAFLGRLAPEKRPDLAIEVAKRANIPLRIAAKVDPADRAYFESKIAPLLTHSLIDYVGEISDEQKADFLGRAMALVAPFDWPEPFGLVFIEALACGTPAIALRRGSIPEIIDDGVTGFICDSAESMAAAIARLSTIDRANCRASFEERFTVERMVQQYVAVYEEVVSEVRT